MSTDLTTEPAQGHPRPAAGPVEVSALDHRATLQAAVEAVRVRRRAEVAEAELLAHWVVLNDLDPAADPDPIKARRACLIGDRLIYPGGEGTPGVQDFALGEIAIARQATDTTTRYAIGDVLDLQYRLPALWARVREAECDYRVAARVARMSRHLPYDLVHVVESKVARVIDREAPSRVYAVAEAAIIEADPDLHEERRLARLRSRYVEFTRRRDDGSPGSEPLDGVAFLRARLDARDAMWLEAAVNRMADLLAGDQPEKTREELRATALGMLADPGTYYATLARHAHDPDPPRVHPDDLTTDDPTTDNPAEPPRDEPPRDEPSRRGRSALIEDPGALVAALDALQSADLGRLRPKAVLHVHLHEAALLGLEGCARVEGIGPVSLAALEHLLGRTDLVVRPVVDLNGQIHSSRYEHPERIKEHVFLINGREYWPFGTAENRQSIENDHVTAYRHPPPGQPPDPDTDVDDESDAQPQTGTHNSGGLSPRHHRWKTHAGYQVRQAGPGRYALRTRHGLGVLIDHTGTRHLDPEKIAMIIDADGTIDVYPAG